MSPLRAPVLLFGTALALTGYRIWVIRHLGIDLYVDEAYYWGWSRALDWGYFSKPPVIAALIAASTAVFGDGLLAIKLPSMLLYPATAFVLYSLGARMYGERAGLWCGMAFLTLPLVGLLGLFVSTDAPLLFCWSVGMLALWRAVHDERWWDWLLLGCAVGLGLLSKYTMAAFLPSALLAMLSSQQGRDCLATRRPWLALALALAIFAPNLWWNWEHQFPTFRHTADITQLDEGSAKPSNLGEFIGAQWLSVGPVLFAALLWALARGLRAWRHETPRFLVIFCLPLLLLVSLQALRGGANGNWAAPAFASGVVLVTGWLVQTRRYRLLMAAVLANLALASGVYHWPDLARSAGVEMTRGKDPYKRARGWQELAATVAPLHLAHPEAILVAPDRELLAHLIYFLRPGEYASWNPRGAVIDHYQLTTSLAGATGRDVLYVSRKPDIAEVSERFDSVEPLGTRAVTIHRDFERRVHVFLLRGFRGYAAPGG